MPHRLSTARQRAVLFRRVFLLSYAQLRIQGRCPVMGKSALQQAQNKAVLGEPARVRFQLGSLYADTGQAHSSHFSEHVVCTYVSVELQIAAPSLQHQQQPIGRMRVTKTIRPSG